MTSWISPRQSVSLRTVGLLVVLATSSAAQVYFSEDFEDVGPVNTGDEGPSNLIADGWVFRNQSTPAVSPAWYPGDGFGGQPLDGAGYLASASTATDFFGGALSTWAILPDLPGLQAGDIVSVYVLGGGSSTTDTFFEIRRSPSGGTDTGSSDTDVGEFTDLLFSAELPVSAQGYQQVLVPVPGAGRLALRMRAPFVMTAFGRGAYLSVDTLTISSGAPPPPCGIPAPQPGEAVTWTLADSPYVVCQDLLIPAGGVVNVEPGVQITFGATNTLRVEGVLRASGTAPAPIVFDGDAGFDAGLDVAGEVDLTHVQMGVHINCGGENAALLVRDASMLAGTVIEGSADLMVFERCLFDGGNIGGFFGVAASVRLADCDFVNGGFADVGGLVYVKNITIDGQPLTIQRENVVQPTLLENISVTNYATGAGLRLRGADYLVESSVVTQGNLYPAELFLTGGGFYPGSSLPETGNTNNYVPAGELAFGANRHWANTGVPYVIEGFPVNIGSLTIEPGVVVRGMPGAGSFILEGAEFNVEGTREQPIRFEPFQLGGTWFGLKWVDVFNARVRNVIFDGCEIAAQSDGGRLLMENCTVQNSLTGPMGVTSGIVTLRNSRIINNNIGLTTTATGRLDAESQASPNILAGNTLAVDYNNTSSAPQLDYIWWGDASGPTTPENPGGTGDAVEGLSLAWFSPWLTTPPPQTDDPPHVELTPVFFTVQAGDKLILRWDAWDDSNIASQRIEFSEHGFTFNVLANLAPTDRSYEFTAPIIPPSNLLEPAAIRVYAVDDAGQETWDEVRLVIPYQEDWTPTPQTVTVTPTPPSPGQNVDVCWSPGGMADAWLLIEGDSLTRGAGGSTVSCLPIGVDAPWVSSDTARAMIRVTFGAGGREAYYFSDFFEIRPDARYGDAPPLVTLDAPRGGEQFLGGRAIMVRWSASDDEALRAFHVQASYDGGRIWHFVEKDLPAAARSFSWALPTSSGIPDVRVRIIAVDRRFQTSSDTSGAFEILPGSAGVPGDVDGDGDVDLTDLSLLLSMFDACNGDPSFDPVADFDGSGCVDLADLSVLLANFGA